MSKPLERELNFEDSSTAVYPPIPSPDASTENSFTGEPLTDSLICATLPSKFFDRETYRVPPNSPSPCEDIFADDEILASWGLDHNDDTIQWETELDVKLIFCTKHNEYDMCFYISENQQSFLD